jgi:hypothetical protein
MKRLKVFLVAMTLTVLASNVLAQHNHGNQWSSSEKKNPAIAAALSLQPLPVDLGGFYAGNWERGAIYTAAEIALFIPTVVFVAENFNWGHHRYDSYYYATANRKTWTDAERNRFYYFVGGYFLVKLISAFDAGYSVERHNAHLSVGYDERRQSLGFSLAIPIP